MFSLRCCRTLASLSASLSGLRCPPCPPPHPWNVWQVGLTTITDLVTKVGFCFYLLAHVDDAAEEEPINTSSQQYV